MLMRETPQETVELFGKTVIISALKGAAIDEFYRLIDADMRKAYAYAFHVCLVYADTKEPVYSTPTEALDAPMCEWNAVRDAWLKVNWPEKNG